VQTNLNVNMQSGAPYTIRTGLDDNGDLIFNDRPAGVGRNSVRGDSQWTANANFSYTVSVGKKGGQLPPAIGVINLNGAPQVQTFNIEQARFRVQFYVQVQNLTNHANYAGYQGGQLSPFFRQPTFVINPRKVDIGLNFMF
jgi:hypothetical protein